jgi:hypothetical protein
MTTASLHDLGFAPEEVSPTELVAALDQQVTAIAGEVERSEFWRTLADPATPDELVRTTLREIYLEIAMYQPTAIEGAVRAIAQFPRQMPVAWWDEMLQHQVEEFDHGEMALRDYHVFGGDVAAARRRRPSPSAFAVAAIWTMIAERRDPFLYLGAVYLFDALTPIMTARAAAALASRRLGSAGLEFITHHATADIAHAEQIGRLIVDVAERYPEAKPSIAYGFAYFSHVYPMPCWNSALARARREVVLTPELAS